MNSKNYKKNIIKKKTNLGSLCPFNCNNLDQYNYNVTYFYKELLKNKLEKKIIINDDKKKETILYHKNKPKFKLLKKIASGGYGKVHNIEDYKFKNKKYICKIIKKKKKFTNNDIYDLLFYNNIYDVYNEVMIHFNLSCISDNVPEIKCVSMDDDNFYIIIEYIKYKVGDYLDNHTLEENVIFVINMFLIISVILKKFQKYKFEHGDLHLGNVMYNINEYGEYKFYIIDFGYSKLTNKYINYHSEYYNIDNKNNSHDLRLLYISVCQLVFKEYVYNKNNKNNIINKLYNEYNKILKKYNIYMCKEIDLWKCFYSHELSPNNKDVYEYIDNYFLPDNFIKLYIKIINNKYIDNIKLYNLESKSKSKKSKISKSKKSKISKSKKSKKYKSKKSKNKK